MRRILVITYWSYREPLIQNYTLPYIRSILQVLPEGSRIALVTMEKGDERLDEKREKQKARRLAEEGVDWYPERYNTFGILAAVRWGWVILKWIWRARGRAFDRVHAWGTPAGSPAYLIARGRGIPLVIDSFEPRSESMVETTQWKKGGIAHRTLFFFEKLQARRAQAVIAVSPTMEAYSWSRYRAFHETFSVKPACVDRELLEERSKLYSDRVPDIKGRVVPIYAGKIGGIYLEEETFDMIRAFYDEWGETLLMFLLTDLSGARVGEWMKKKGIPSHVLYQEWVPPEAVPAFMAHAHFALNPVRPVPSKRHCTSIKDGEYWAMGLPVLIPDGIGEDSGIIKRKGIGVVLDKGLDQRSIRKGVKEMRGMIEQEEASGLKDRIQRTAEEERGFERAYKVYQEVYEEERREAPLKVLLIAYYNHDDAVFHSALLDYFRGLAPKRDLCGFLLTFEEGAPDQEETETISAEWIQDGIYWEHVRSRERNIKSIQKGSDFLKGILKGKRMVKDYGIDLVYSEGFPSAIIGHHVASTAHLPYVVHTYEPHADYMAEAGIWSPKGWEYRITRKYEQKVGRMASILITGTRRMKERVAPLKEKEKVWRIPSCVDLSFFSFSQESRDNVRKKYGIPSKALVLTYLGKLGGMYYDEELFELFKVFCKEVPERDPYFMIHTSMNEKEVRGIAEKCGVDPRRIIVDQLQRKEVPDHLSAADVGLSGVRQTPSKAYCSPIKHGEYWGCGLPLLVFRGVSEDDELVEQEGSGIVIERPDRASFQKAVEKTVELLKEGSEELRLRARRTAEKERSLEKARKELKDLLFSLARSKEKDSKNE
ncbi:MAG: glycosyltransferase [Flavobacteriales bacterium]